VITDQNGNGVAEFAVLVEQRVTGQVRVLLKDALTGEGVRNVTFDGGYAPRAVTVIDVQ
jgi:hypothetical protein